MEFEWEWLSIAISIQENLFENTFMQWHAFCIKCIIFLDQSTSPSSIQIMMTPSNENLFRITGLLWGELTRHRWIPITKASDAELWYFLWSAPAWINDWVSTRKARDLRSHRTPYDVTVMSRPHACLHMVWPHHLMGNHDGVLLWRTFPCYWLLSATILDGFIDHIISYLKRWSLFDFFIDIWQSLIKRQVPWPIKLHASEWLL